MGTHRLASRDWEDDEASGTAEPGGDLPRPGEEHGEDSCVGSHHGRLPSVLSLPPVLSVLSVPSVFSVPSSLCWLQLLSLLLYSILRRRSASVLCPSSSPSPSSSSIYSWQPVPRPGRVREPELGYNNINSMKQEVGNTYGGVQGAYSYVDTNGELQRVEYVADHLGFRVADSRLPVAPTFQPEPLMAPEDTAEVKAAKAAHMAAVEAAAQAAGDRKRREAEPGFAYGFPTFHPQTHYLPYNHYNFYNYHGLPYYG